MLQDKDFAADALDMAKHESVEYTKAAIECSDQNLRNMFLDFARECLQEQWNLYRLAEKKGWYIPAAPADVQEIQQVRQHYQPSVQTLNRQPAMV